MKRILFVFTFVALACTFAMGQQKNAKLEAQLIQMDRDWTAAELRGDTAKAGTYVADDFWGTQPNGERQNKTQYLAALKATKDTDMADDYVVRFFAPDVAVMTHRGTVKGERDYQYRSTHVWVNRDGKWQIVAHHSSEVGPATAMTMTKSDMAPKAAKKPKMMPSNAAAPAAATDDAKP